jgi:hypothetical protein
MISKIKKDEQEWALSVPKPQHSGAGGVSCFTGQKAKVACWGWPSPWPNVARPDPGRPAQAGAACSARTLGSHRAQSWHSEPVAKVQWGLRLKHQCGGVNPRGMDRGVGAHRGVLPTGWWRKAVGVADGDARQGSSGGYLRRGRGMWGSQRTEVSWTTKRGPKGSLKPMNRRRIPTVALFTVAGNKWECGDLGGS